uniref:Ubiquitin-like protease family profile domain-containing protein n=1 Tax=Brassica oleracea var. oleracea TaxID=109376 RepID=A0A0D3A0N7_BRAOL
MYVFRERTTLKRWNVDRVAFMTCVFSDLIAKDYQNFCKGIKKYTMDPLLLQYGKGELPSHGRTRMLWNVDVDQMYVPVWVKCNHWIALCISFVTRN